MVMGDFNTKVGAGADDNYVRKYSLGKRNPEVTDSYRSASRISFS